MQILTYSKLALETENTDFPNIISRAAKNIRFLHGVLTLVTEVEEVINLGDEPLSKELGDCFWGLNLAVSSLGLNEEVYVLEQEGELLDTFTLTGELINAVAKIADIAKKSIYYGKIYERTALVSTLKRVFNLLVTICGVSGLDWEDVLDLNIKKLKARYPDKFNADRAINK